MGRPRGPRSIKFDCVPPIDGACIYVVELTGGIVKIGHSVNPARRFRKIEDELARKQRGVIVRHCVAERYQCHQVARKDEARLVRALAAVAKQLPRTREYFSGIDFDTALAVVREVVSPRPSGDQP